MSLYRSILRPMQLCIMLSALMLPVTLSYAAVVKEVKSSQVGSRMLFEYEFSGQATEEGKVGIDITVGGQTYSSDKLHLEGDFGKIKAGKAKKLWWNVLQDFPKGISGEMYFDIHSVDITEKDLSKANKLQLVDDAIHSMNADSSELLNNISYPEKLKTLSDSIDSIVIKSHVDELNVSSLNKAKIYCAASINSQKPGETITPDELITLASKSKTISDDNYEKFINCFLGSFDSHSSWMSAEAYQFMKTDTKGAFSGVGIEITIKDQVLTVISPIEDSPAYKAGIQAGDQIVKIDDAPTKDMDITNAVKRMRGLKGTKVTLTVLREGSDKPREFALTRNTILVKSVKYRSLKPGYGYVRISQFQEKTSDDLAKALDVLKSENQGKLRGLVLDLRNDPGGLLDQAVRVVERFVDAGELIVYTKGKESDSNMRFTSKSGDKQPGYPIVVLINSGSASASEIVTGALQDHKRAIVMGRRSFGKGSVQTIIPLTDGSGLRLTTSRYFTPSGRSIHGTGITPDLVLKNVVPTQDNDADILFAEKFLQESEGVAGYDKRVEMAKNLKRQEPSLLGVAGKVNVFPAPPKLTAKVGFFEPSGNGMLDAEEKGALNIVLVNSGKGDAFDVTLEVQPDREVPGLSASKALAVGTIPAGQTVTRELPLVASEQIASAEVQFTVSVKEANGFDALPVALAFRTKEHVPPLLRVASVEIESADSGRVIRKGMQATVTVGVQNAGMGTARGVVASIASGDKNIMLYDAEPVTIGVLNPGETKKATFSLAVNQRYQGGKDLPVTFTLSEERERFRVTPKVQLTLNQEAPVLQVTKVAAREAAPVAPTSRDDDGVPTIAPENRAYNLNDVALVIGIERYRNKLPPSLFSYRDARLVKEYLLALGFSERNIELLTDENATLTDIRTAVERKLKNRVMPNSRVFVYYSGHGAPDPATGSAYLVPYDGDPNYIDATGYPLRQFYESLGKLKAKEVLVVLDSCFSGAGSGGNSRTVLARGARPLVMMADQGGIPGRIAVLSATSGAQISTTYTEKEQGLLTWYFLKGIREGKAGLSELYTWLKPYVEDEARRQNVEQSPGLKLGAAANKQSFQLRR
jgi:carboxyl-terminal processing protease